jgi:hypothetical protein
MYRISISTLRVRGAAIALLEVARWRPERLALLLGVVVVATGAIAAGLHVADGVADSRVEYGGKLDAGEIRRTFSPTGPAGQDDPVPRFKDNGLGYLSSAEGVMTVEHDGGALVLWSIHELAPWFLAAMILALLAPIVRAADHDNPFRDGTARRLTWVGTLLLAGIPGIALLGFVAAQTASTGGFAAPTAQPTLTLSLTQALPGVLVLVLARIVRRGIELGDLDRHTI